MCLMTHTPTGVAPKRLACAAVCFSLVEIFCLFGSDERFTLLDSPPLHTTSHLSCGARFSHPGLCAAGYRLPVRRASGSAWRAFFLVKVLAALI